MRERERERKKEREREREGVVWVVGGKVRKEKEKDGEAEVVKEGCRGGVTLSG